MFFIKRFLSIIKNIIQKLKTHKKIMFCFNFLIIIGVVLFLFCCNSWRKEQKPPEEKPVEINTRLQEENKRIKKEYEELIYVMALEQKTYKEELIKVFQEEKEKLKYECIETLIQEIIRWKKNNQI